ncbi:aspartate aminotransferase family protein [Photobacterium galatheae]|uniref:Diaminobutyrate--2-oxoglutarate aminotransferase n=1 Tax=Photobacterium galatheae TaxID=1654360 RepID=A0A066RMB6_9GAMM|nr:aspartate aminotransferase family protein [Photobacterium galatheae]KDM90236.1 diaminobutyrate--2-oxoglutarate aminotransferase [Photobacterium galatheae]MCM0151501.1 aspartate aminotransferase family protein [Photobacterium galatheae]
MSIFEQRESEIRAYCRVYPTVFDTALNARQTDENGKEYIDFFAGAGVLNFGHNNERMKQAVIDYLQRNGVTHSLDMHTCAKRDFMARFSRIILEPRNMPHKMQFMGPTGTNAVEAALKLARRATGRHEVVAFHHGFHGMTLGSLACTANQYFRGAAGVPLSHVSHAAFGAEGASAETAMQALKLLAESYSDGSSGVTAPAAFLVEVVQAEGGVNIADRTWLQALASLAKSVGALLIVDDIQSGMGRTGSFFSFDDYGIDPDIICLAKGLGGLGTPIAMNLVKPEYDRHWSPGEHTGTFRGQCLSFVAGSEALSYFEDRYFEDRHLMAEVKEKGALMQSALAILTDHDVVEIRGKGMLFGVDVGDGERAKTIVSRCFEAGLLVSACGSGGRVIKLIPPLTIPEADLKAGLAILVAVTQDVLGEVA